MSISAFDGQLAPKLAVAAQPVDIRKVEMPQADAAKTPNKEGVMESARNGPEKRRGCKLIVGGIIAGVVLSAVFAYALNYTDQRQFCGSCHLMREAARTQKMGPHANLTCNECHAPHALLVKIPFKAKAGAEDILGNIAGKDLPIPPSRTQRDVINQNCIACHGPVNKAVASMAVKPYCVDCHRGVAHMRLNPISQRMVAYD